MSRTPVVKLGGPLLPMLSILLFTSGLPPLGEVRVLTPGPHLGYREEISHLDSKLGGCEMLGETAVARYSEGTLTTLFPCRIEMLPTSTLDYSCPPPPLHNQRPTSNVQR